MEEKIKEVDKQQKDKLTKINNNIDSSKNSLEKLNDEIIQKCQKEQANKENLQKQINKNIRKHKKYTEKIDNIKDQMNTDVNLTKSKKENIDNDTKVIKHLKNVS